MLSRIDPFDSEVVRCLKLAFTQLGASLPSDDAQIQSLLARPPEFALGQRAYPTHGLAKVLRQPPVKIAESVAEKIKAISSPFITDVKALQGYVNFFGNREAYAANLVPRFRSLEYFGGAPKRPKILVEYSQPNTHKALHVGHLRNTVYGDAICDVLEYHGHPMVRATYPGDFGAHIAKCLFYVKTQWKKDPPAEDRANWLGEMYCRADDFVKSKEGTPEEVSVRAEIGVVLAQLQAKQGPYYDLYLETREWSLAQMRGVYDWLGVKFDVWFYESECDEPSRELVKKKYEEGFLEKSDGAIGKDLSQWNLGFAMFLKSDGNGLYLTKDLELIRRKFEDPEVERSIVVVDTRQKLHFQQLFKTAELMGYPQAAKSEHLAYETVTDEKGEAFSSRTMNGMRLHELREVMEKKVISQYLETYRGQWTDAEIQKTAEQVTLGALKYGFLRVDGNNIIRFVLDEWLKLDGETGPYLQYVHARCSSLLQKVGRAPASVAWKFTSELEGELLFHLGRFNESAAIAAETRRPAVLAGYLYDLGKTFNRFYRDCPIKDAEPEVRDVRLALVEATKIALAKGLSLLGIPAPERM